jgi:tetratricopeptide (TPR) repeat protein
LTPDEAVALMHRIVGERVLSDTGAAAEVARRCEYLTLAVRLAAARLAHRPSWTVRDLAVRLAVLDEIAAEGRSVVAAFGLSYSQVSGGAQRMFRLLGLHPGPDIEVRAAASLAGLELDEADAALGELVDAHLLDEPTAGRYRLHDLLKEYAARLVEADMHRRDALERLFDFYLHTAAAAANALEYPINWFDYKLGDPPPLALVEQDPAPARTWLETESVNLVALFHAAADAQNHEVGWRLARAIWRPLFRNGYHDDCLATLQRVLETASRAADKRASGMAYNYMAATYFRLGHWVEARNNIDRAMAAYAAIGDQREWAKSLGNLARILIRSGDYVAALDSVERAARAHAETGSPAVVLASLNIDLGHANMLLGRYSTAREQFERFLRYAEGSRNDADMAVALAHLGMLELRLGRFAAALDLLRRSERLQAFGDVADLAEWMCVKGSAYRGLGNLEQALRWQLEALEAIERSGSLYHECDVRIELAITLHLAGHDDDAKDHVDRALAIADRLNLQPQRGKALDVLATITKDSTLHDQATTIYAELGLPRPPTPPTLEE